MDNEKFKKWFYKEVVTMNLFKGLIIICHSEQSEESSF